MTTKYIAYDGTEFDSQSECEYYEHLNHYDLDCVIVDCRKEISLRQIWIAESRKIIKQTDEEIKGLKSRINALELSRDGMTHGQRKRAILDAKARYCMALNRKAIHTTRIKLSKTVIRDKAALIRATNAEIKEKFPEENIA